VSAGPERRRSMPSGVAGGAFGAFSAGPGAKDARRRAIWPGILGTCSEKDRGTHVAFASAMSRYQVRDRLVQDHARLERTLEQVLAAFEANDQDGVATSWGKFDTELLAHLDAEERFLIPALFQVNQRAARTILEEHRHIRTRLTELGAGVDLHIVRLTTARAFIEELRAHARHEDTLLYQWADEHVGEADRGLLLNALTKATGIEPGAIA
jgi:hemerythrin-like domain-containing protein